MADTKLVAELRSDKGSRPAGRLRREKIFRSGKRACPYPVAADANPPGTPAGASADQRWSRFADVEWPARLGDRRLH